MIPQTIHQVEASAAGPVRHLDPRVRRVIAFMEENYHRDLSLDKLAQSVNLSIWHLVHLFKTETGKPPVQYLKSLRMSQGKKLLETTSLSVKEVMSKVGMSDQSHFAKDFKRAYGMTPTKYRAAVRSGNGHEIEDVAHKQ